jgi:transcriptional regulator with XRE-family HTH domain
LSKIVRGFSAEDQADIRRQAEELIVEHRSLAQIRKALNLTQADVADLLRTSQANIAQIEQKKDVMVSTLDRVVRAMGGELELVVTMPRQGRVVLELGNAKDKTIVRPKSRKARAAAPTRSASRRRLATG